MKKTPRQAARSQMSLGELIQTVNRYSRNQQEAVAAVADLLDSGRIRFQSNGRKIRARVSR